MVNISINPVTFISHGDKISGNLVAPVGNYQAKFAFLFIQGWMGHQNLDAATALAELGFTTLTYNMRGNAPSEGDLEKLARAGYLDDAVAAYDFLKQQVGESMPIGIVGSSFGSYIGILLSEKREIVCMSLRVPANYPDEGFDEPQWPQIDKTRIDLKATREWRNKKLDYTQNRALGALHNFKGDVQVIEAEKDERVPHTTVANYVAATVEERLSYEVMHSAPHRLSTSKHRSDYSRLLVAWTKRLRSYDTL